MDLSVLISLGFLSARVGDSGLGVRCFFQVRLSAWSVGTREPHRARPSKARLVGNNRNRTASIKFAEYPEFELFQGFWADNFF